MISRLACSCKACRIRNDRTFWRIVAGLEIGLYPAHVWPETESIVDRINRYGLSRRSL